MQLPVLHSCPISIVLAAGVAQRFSVLAAQENHLTEGRNLTDALGLRLRGPDFTVLEQAGLGTGGCVAE